jgi:hypothetical protein
MHRPQDAKELFNLRHTSLRNIIERIFGVLKRQWRILQIAPEYHMDIQARVPAALCAIHNFIRRQDPDLFCVEEDYDLAENDDDDHGGASALGTGPADTAERRGADARRDAIAAAMWADYVEERARRGMPL